MPTSKDFTCTRALMNMFRNVMKYSNCWKMDWASFDCKRKARGTHTPAHGRDSTSRMRTTILCGKWHPHTTISPLWGPTSVAQQLGNERGRPRNTLLPKWVQSSLSSGSSSQHMCELLAGNRTAVLPRHARGRQIMGLVYACPLL